MIQNCVGKQIISINNETVNVLNIVFTDGTFLQLETEHMGGGLYGIVPTVGSKSHFPIKILLQRTKEPVVVNSPNEIPSGRSFTVIGTRVNRIN